MTGKTAKTAQSRLYACPSDPCRVATFSSATALAKCPACDADGLLLRYPIVFDVGGTARFRALREAAAREAEAAREAAV